MSRQRLAALALGLALAACAGWAVLHFARGEPETLELVPSSEAVQELMRGSGEREWVRLFPDSELRRFRMTREVAETLWPRRFEWKKRFVFDPATYFWRRPNSSAEITWPEHPDGRYTVRANGIGLRRDSELAAEKVGVRVLVTGDSHVDGYCNNSESFTALLEARLEEARGAPVEVLNAGVTDFNPYNYLGVLEKHLPLEPDLFVVTVYGGNDFSDVLTLHHLFAGTERPPGIRDYPDEFEDASRISRSALGQGFVALKYFQVQPGQVAVSLAATTAVLGEVRRLCAANGVGLLVVYLPPRSDFEWGSYRREFGRLAEALGLGPEDLGTTDRLADELLVALAGAGIGTVDLRPVFRPDPDHHYWSRDLHLNLAGQQAVAEALFPVVSEALSTADASR